MENLDVGILIALIVLEFSAIAVNAAYAESLKPGFDFWTSFAWWFDRIGVAIAAIALLLYLIKERSDRNKEKELEKERFNRSCIALLREIRENRDHLNRDDDRLFFSYVRSKQTVDFSNIVFDTYAFQSIIHSGLLTYFDEDIQARLAQLYSRFDGHNESLTYRSHLQTEFFLYGRPQTFNNYLEERERYDLFLTETEGEIKQLFTGVEQSLEMVKEKNLTRV